MGETFVTAEESQNPGRGVWVMLTVISTMIEGAATPSAFTITTSTGYRAEMRACPCDRTPCRRRCDAHGHCHYGIHLQTARAIADEVAATYGSASRRDRGALSGLRAHPKRVKSVGVKAWAADPYAAALEARRT